MKNKKFTFEISKEKLLIAGGAVVTALGVGGKVVFDLGVKTGKKVLKNPTIVSKALRDCRKK